MRLPNGGAFYVHLRINLHSLLLMFTLRLMEESDGTKAFKIGPVIDTGSFSDKRLVLVKR